MDVVAALIWDNDKFLICQRPPNKTLGLLWEFVGGKVESNESKEEALFRECKEELGVEITVGDQCMNIIHDYPDFTISLHLFNAVITKGFPQSLEHDDVRWITINEISKYNFCPADEKIIKELVKVKQ